MVLDSINLATPKYKTTAELALLPAAGAGTSPSVRETARDALTWEQRPPTPPAIKQGGYQHYARQDPGAIVRHFGTARDPLKQGPFGCETKVGVESAADCFKALPDSEIARWKQERAEDIFIRCGCQHALGRAQSVGSHAVAPRAAASLRYLRTQTPSLKASRAQMPSHLRASHA